MLTINRRKDRRVPGGGRDRIAIEWSRARKREKRARVSGPADSLHCFVFKCTYLANDWWSAYSRSLPFAVVRGSIQSRFDRALRTTSAHNKSVNTCGPNALLDLMQHPRCVRGFDTKSQGSP